MLKNIVPLTAIAAVAAYITHLFFKKSIDHNTDSVLLLSAMVLGLASIILNIANRRKK